MSSASRTSRSTTMRLRRRGAAPQAEEGGHRALVHDRLLREGGLLAVVDDREVEGLRVLEGAAHQARARHRPAVVGDRHAARVPQVAVLGQLLAPRGRG